MSTARRFTAVSFVAVVALSLGAGCAVEAPEEAAGETHDELTNSVCVPRAEKKKAEHLKTCGGGASLTDAVACVTPHFATLNAYYRDLRSLERTWDAGLTKIVDDCVAKSNACPTDPAIEALVAAGYPRDKLPAHDCAAALDKARDKCSDQIEPALEKLDPNHPYLVKKRQGAAEVGTFVRTSLGCVLGEAGDALSTLKCQTIDAGIAYNAELARCHGQCPTATKSTGGCKPEGYTNIPECGEIKTVWGECQCVATSYCKDFVAQQGMWSSKAKEAGVRKILCDDAKSYKAPLLTYDAAGKPNHLYTTCLPL
ncbi:hypothetical protein BH11MYX4_BH11MYX4_40650 [soil metagenome]